MAGRPKTMARKITELEARALQLAQDYFELMPKMYRDQVNPQDPINQSWNKTLDQVMGLLKAIEQLGDLYRAKAGILDPGPITSFQAALQKQ